MTEQIYVRARKFLQDFFNDDDLTNFCFDYFPQVYKDFTQGMSKSQKVRILVDFCQRHDQIRNLLTRIREERPNINFENLSKDMYPASQKILGEGSSFPSENEPSFRRSVKYVMYMLILVGACWIIWVNFERNLNEDTHIISTPTIESTTMIIGYSVEGKPIRAMKFGNGPIKVVFVGGLHDGSAPSSVMVAQESIEYFRQNPEKIPSTVTLFIIESINPDSPDDHGTIEGRLNKNGVDINRNWDCDWKQDSVIFNEVVLGSGGEFPFSEPETQALFNFITNHQPTAVILWDARAENGLVVPGSCSGQGSISIALGETYGNAANYEVASIDRFLVSGDASNWLDSQGIPAITVLLPHNNSIEWDRDLAGIIAVLNAYSE